MYQLRDDVRKVESGQWRGAGCGSGTPVQRRNNKQWAAFYVELHTPYVQVCAYVCTCVHSRKTQPVTAFSAGGRLYRLYQPPILNPPCSTVRHFLHTGTYRIIELLDCACYQGRCRRIQGIHAQNQDRSGSCLSSDQSALAILVLPNCGVAESPRRYVPTFRYIYHTMHRYITSMPRVRCHFVSAASDRISRPCGPKEMFKCCNLCGVGVVAQA